MREPQKVKKGVDNWITGGVMLLVWLIVHMLAPDMENRWSLLIALGAGIAASVVLYLIRKRQKEKEEEEKLPPI